jgi:hypothetical protein
LGRLRSSGIANRVADQVARGSTLARDAEKEGLVESHIPGTTCRFIEPGLCIFEVKQVVGMQESRGFVACKSKLGNWGVRVGNGIKVQKAKA